MDRAIIKLGVIIMAISAMFTMSACSKINNDTSSKVCKALEERYGETFIAKKIGDRFHTNTAKLYVYPEKNEEILFTATIDRETGNVYDTYLLEKVNNDIEKILTQCFSNEAMEAYAQCMVIAKESFDISKDNYTPLKLQEIYGFEHYSIYFIMNTENMTPEKIERALININKEIGVKMIVSGYIFETDNYKACLEKMKENPEISTTIIEKELPRAAFDVIVDNEACSMSIEEFTSIVEGL